MDPNNNQLDKPTPQIHPEKNAERLLPVENLSPAPVPVPTERVAPATPPPIPVLPSAQSAPPVQITSVQASDSDLVAEDKDIIEKEWVDKAEKIIEQNQNDPRKEEEEVDKLSKDYQEKRFNISAMDD